MTRLSSALSSSDLSHREYECDSDLIRACGLAAMRRPLGVLIVEAMEGAVGDGPHASARVRDLQSALQTQVRRWARRYKIMVNLRGVASLIARELIFDLCHHCQGRGYIPMRYDGTRAVYVGGESAVDTIEADCPVCLGSKKAKRNYYARAKAAGHEEYTKDLDEFWKSALSRCAEAEAGARSDMWRRLNR